MKKTVITLALLLFALIIKAQEVSFTAAAPSVVQSGQQFRLVYTLNAKGTNFKAPDLSKFIILGGPSTSSSSNISFVNGAMNQSVTNQYTYFLQAAEEGTFTISPAGIIAGNKTYTSNAVTIQVTKGNGGNQQSRQNQQNQQTQENNSGQSNTSNEDLFVRIVLNKSSVYQGEQIIATLKIYTRGVNLVGFEEFKFPNYKGFWSEDIAIPNQITLVQENYNGKMYNVGVLKKTVLFPQKSGEITIEPFELKLMVQERAQQTQRNFWDSFFNQYQNVSKRLVSPSVRVTVKPLPAAPAGFAGAVGDYKLTSKADPLNLKANESLSLTYSVSGNGNLRLVEMPAIQIPPQFEKYDPKISENIKASVNGVSGSKSSETLLIPRSAGVFTIPSAKFVYFNPDKQKYEVITTPSYTVNVAKGSQDSSVSFVSGINKEDLMMLGSDIRFIETKYTDLKNKKSFILPSTIYLLAYIILLIAFILIIIFRRNYIKRNADRLMVKNRRAGKEARKRLSKAKKLLHSNDKEKFFEEILRALWGYYADKMKIETSLLNKEMIIQSLAQQNMDETFISKIKDLIEECEYARYAPPGSTSSPEDVYMRSAEVINESEKKLK